MEPIETDPHSRDGDRTLVIMAKAPRPGTVKTRLARSLPVEAVTELYRCLLDDTMALARSVARREGCDHVSCVRRRRAGAVGRRCDKCPGAARGGPCGGADVGVCPVRATAGNA